MSERPTPITPSDTLLSLVLDELQGLRADLAGRGGAPKPQEPAKKTPAKATAKRTQREVDGR